MKVRRIVIALAPLVVAACGAPPGAGQEPVGTTSAAVSTSSIVSLALANVGLGACSTNSEDGAYFDSSCTGNGGQPEYWCADFARWVWAQAGASDTSDLTAAAGSFYVYGQTYGTLHDTPTLGDAVVFDYQGGGVADHVAIVTQVNSDGTIETVSGDWNGQSGSEATFASTSSVVLNTPAYADGNGTTPAVMGMTISGYISPVGAISTPFYAAAYMKQSFPLATTALEMKAGETLAESITLTNSGTIAWDGNTRLGTTQPRDRDSVFADSSWISPDRPAGVVGTVAPGASYTFKFDLHAPSTPGTYFEYFNLVEEGVAWFSDPGQGGPSDNDLEAQIVVVAGPDDAGDGAQGDGGSDDTGNGSGGEGEDAGAPSAATPGPVFAGAADAGTAAANTSQATSSSAGGSAGGCAIAQGGGGSSGGGGAGCALFVLALVLRRRRAVDPRAQPCELAVRT